MKKLLRSIAVSLMLTAALTAGILAAADTERGSYPVAENLEITTYRGVSVGGKLSAVAPDGGELTYEIVTPPGKGEIELSSDGHFVYTPYEGRKGKDYFGYKAIDSSGARSQEATVIIRITKQKTKIVYSDMAGSGEEYAAAALAESGIFTGENLAGTYVFSPDTLVSRQEFLAMCMKLAGTELLTGVRSTGFADDASIAAWAKPYVSTALKCGIVSGYASGDRGAVFNGGDSISVSEAAVILDRVLDLTDVSPAWVKHSAEVPEWAAQSAANLAACGIFTEESATSDAVVTRAKAAEMLSSAMALLSGR